MKQDDLVIVARIGKTVGLRGELKLHIISDFSSQFTKNSTYYLQDLSTITIEKFNQNNNRVKFKTINYIDEAKKLTNQDLFVTKEQSQNQLNLTKNQFLWFDILGYHIVENDLLLGSISKIDRINDIDYLLINTNDKLNNMPKRFCLPYQDRYILNVDKDKKTIYVQEAKDILENS